MRHNEIATSNTAIAIEKLRSLIFSGQLGAGTDHLESELAARLGMSRTPVREALLRLEAQGLLEVRPRKGVRITSLSPHDMAEVYDVLTELESLAAANAAQAGLTDVELAGLSDAVRETWAAADDAFHTELVRLGGNQRLQRIAEMMSDQVRRARLVTLYMRPEPSASNNDPDRARMVHRTHRIAAKDTLIALLERHHLSNL